MISKEFEAITLDYIRGLRGYSLATLKRATVRIPEISGIYVWRYWPSFSDLEKEKFIQMLSDWGDSQPSFSDEVSNSRLNITVKRSPFGNITNKDNILGYEKNHHKAVKLLQHVQNEPIYRQSLANLIEIIVGMSPPLYIGKADNLRERLTQHFERKSSNLLHDIDEAGISHQDIYISFIKDEVSTEDEKMTTTFEEILQRITNPPLTKRYG